jgi:16S rRNA processing protein RimM
VADLIGLRVETTDGRTVGLVRDVLETGANDVYAVDVEGREVLIPAVDHVVRLIDVENGRVVIEAMEGLLD